MAASVLRDIIAGIIVLGVLVLLHEWGHFIVAKLCGVRVDIFSVGIGPRVWGVKRGATDYRISALPLGGYVKMAGDNPVDGRAGAEDEFLSRPRWQRFLIAVAGPAMNVLTTFLIFCGIYAFKGMPTDAYLRQPADVVAVARSSRGASPMQPGDTIVVVNGVPTPTWNRAMTQAEKARPGETLSVTVRRGGALQSLSVRVPQRTPSFDFLLGYPSMPPVIDEVSSGLPAEKAGLKGGDTILSINGQPVVTWPQVVERVTGAGPQPIHFVVRRDGAEIPFDVAPTRRMNQNGEMVWVIGAFPRSPVVFERQGWIASVQDAGAETWFYTRMIGEIAGGLFRGRVSVRELAGPVGIVQMSGQAAKGGVVTLLTWMAYISLDLGLLNLLPIPIFDGGQIMMLAVEGALRHDLRVSVKERLVQVGVVFLLGLFAFLFFNDIVRLINR